MATDSLHTVKIILIVPTIIRSVIKQLHDSGRKNICLQGKYPKLLQGATEAWISRNKGKDIEYIFIQAGAPVGLYPFFYVFQTPAAWRFARSLQHLNCLVGFTSCQSLRWNLEELQGLVLHCTDEGLWSATVRTGTRWGAFCFVLGFFFYFVISGREVGSFQLSLPRGGVTVSWAPAARWFLCAVDLRTSCGSDFQPNHNPFNTIPVLWKLYGFKDSPKSDLPAHSPLSSLLCCRIPAGPSTIPTLVKHTLLPSKNPDSDLSKSLQSLKSCSPLLIAPLRPSQHAMAKLDSLIVAAWVFPPFCSSYPRETHRTVLYSLDCQKQQLCSATSLPHLSKVLGTTPVVFVGKSQC